MRRYFYGLLAATALAPGSAWAIDVSPADYTVLPPGTNLILGYAQYSTARELHVDGAGKVPSSDLDVAVGLARYVHYSELGGVPISVQAIAPFGNLDARIGGADQPIADGLGDITLGATVYPVHSADPTGTTLGVTAFLTLPTGAYDPAKISLGSGTWTFTPQVGVIQGLGNGFFFDGILDAAFEADHDEGAVAFSRDPSVQVQAYMRYQFSQATSVSFGYSGKFGGKQFTNGSYTGLKTRSDQLRLFANHFFTPTLQLQGMIGSDVNVEGGFKNDFVTQLRLLKVF